MDGDARQAGPAPSLPAYGGACLTSLLEVLLDRTAPPPPWLAPPLVGAAQVVLLVLDGLGWEQLGARAGLAPTLSAMAGGPLTSVVPTTTATALTSISTGLTPADHGVVGYRVRVGRDEVLNVLRWRTARGDATTTVPPAGFQVHPPFLGRRPPVVTRAEFGTGGFTAAHLGGTRLVGWRVSSSLPVIVEGLLEAGEPFVYVYYDGIDKVAHEYGFGPFYDAELRAADHLVADLLAVLPAGAALAVTADHGQVEVGERVVPVPDELLGMTSLLSGEGRFRWLHARPGQRDRLAAAARDRCSDLAWVRTVDELEDEGWFGGPISPAGRDRLGDVALIPFAPVAFTDPADVGELALRCRHGSVTTAEMLVPLLGARA